MPSPAAVRSSPRATRLTLRRAPSALAGAAATIATAPALPWRPAGDVAALRGQLPGLVADPPPMLLAGPVVALALGAGPALVAMARPGCRSRMRWWISAWCTTEAYLEALAAPRAMRFDRHGQPVEAVTDEHQAEARRRLADLQRRRPR